MFERFTDRARRVVVLAQDEAREMSRHDAGTGCILLGMIAEGEGVAAQVLAGLGVTLGDTRDRLARISPPAEQPPAGHIAFTPASKNLLGAALRESMYLGHNYIGTEHLLLAVARLDDCQAMQVLAASGHSPDDLRAAVMTKLHGYEDTASRVRPGQQPAAVRRGRGEPTRAEILAAVTAVADRLADLDGYIERRAAELAAPMIEDARQSAALDITAARSDILRQADLVAELRRCIAARDRVIDGLQKEREETSGA